MRATARRRLRGGSIPADLVASLPGGCPVSELNRLLSENLAIVIGAIAAVLVILLLAVLAQSLRLRRATRAYRQLVAGADSGDGGAHGGSLRQVLDGHIGQVRQVSSRLDDLSAMTDYLEQRTRGSLQHIGLVRFNPFDDTGSDQSFAIALLDDRRDGIVISSLHGRANTRVFAKPVENGSSRHALSNEEADAIRIAVEGTTPVPTAR
jgi:uncharacterized protein DUF4446